MKLRCQVCSLCLVLITLPALAQADELTFKNAGKDPITMEFHRRGEKAEPRIPLPLKADERRALKPQEDTYYGLIITDHEGNAHCIGYRRMRGLAVKHPGAVIEVRPEVKEVDQERELVVMVPVVRKVVGENGDVKEVTEYRAETRTQIVTRRKIASFRIVLTKDGADDLPLEFRKFAKEPKVEP